jgi:tetratricopeptide (TPR) repeat protein
MMSPRQIREGLEDRFHLLTGGPRTTVQRHQTLRASIDWSFELLGEQERVLVARLSVFAGGFTLGLGPGSDRRKRHPSGLVDRSLVQADESLSVERYHLLETIREHAAEQLLNAGEVDTVRDRHAAFFRSLAETAEPHLEGHEQVAWADLLEQERANLRDSIQWAAARGDGETAQRMVTALTWFFVIRGHLREAKKLFDVALDTRGATTATHARALQARSYLGWHRHEGWEAIAMATEAAELARQVDDRRTEARALYVSGFLTADDGDGLTDLAASIAIARELGDLWGLAHALGGVGTIYSWRLDSQQAQAFLRESIAVCEAMGDTYIVNTSRFHLGRILLVSGERAAGRAMLEAVVTRARELGDTFSLPMALVYLGMDYAHCGDDELGFAYLDEALAITRRLGLPREEQLAMALWLKAITLLRKQDPAVRPVLEERARCRSDTDGLSGRRARAAVVRNRRAARRPDRLPAPHARGRGDVRRSGRAGRVRAAEDAGVT